MSLQTTIKEEVKNAMKAKDTLKLNTLRNLTAAFTNELVAKGMKPQEDVPDNMAINVIKRYVKQRKDSIEQFEKGGRQDLVDSEKAELAIAEAYLPASMSKEDIKKVAEAKKAEMNVTDKSKMRMLIGAVSKELKGQADGADIKEVVESLFV